MGLPFFVRGFLLEADFLFALQSGSGLLSRSAASRPSPLASRSTTSTLAAYTQRSIELMYVRSISARCASSSCETRCARRYLLRLKATTSRMFIVPRGATCRVFNHGVFYTNCHAGLGCGTSVGARSPVVAQSKRIAAVRLSLPLNKHIAAFAPHLISFSNISG